MSSMTPEELLTPASLERKMLHVVTEMTRANGALAQARGEETDAEFVYRRARDAASLKAPRVERGGYTVDQRNEFIDAAVRGEWEQWQRAVMRRERAQDLVRMLRDQASLVQSLAASVRTAYGVSGVAP